MDIAIEVAVIEKKTQPPKAFGDATLIAAIDEAFAELAQSGELAKLFVRWHVPYVAPNEKEKSVR